MMKYNIDLSACASLSSVHEVLASVIPLPDYYGKNLDALYDVLTDISEDTEIIVSFDQSALSDAQKRLLLRVMRDAECQNAHLTVKTAD